MKKIIFLVILFGLAFAGYCVYKFVSSKKDELLNIEKPIVDNLKIPVATPTPTPTPLVVPTTTPVVSDDSIVIANLLSVASAQNHWENDFGSYANSLKKLEKSKKSSPQLKKVIDSFNSGKDCDGYIFAEITDDKDSDDTRAHYGFLATPITPKSKSFVLIMDINKKGLENGNSESHDDIQVYESPESTISFKSWPTADDLKSWKPLKVKIPVDAKKGNKKEAKKFEFNNNEDNE